MLDFPQRLQNQPPPNLLDLMIILLWSNLMVQFAKRRQTRGLQSINDAAKIALEAGLDRYDDASTNRIGRWRTRLV